MTARKTSLIVNRFRTASTRPVTRALRLSWAPILLCTLLLAPLASQAALRIDDIRGERTRAISDRLPEATLLRLEDGTLVDPTLDLRGALITIEHDREGTDTFDCRIEDESGSFLDMDPSSMDCTSPSDQISRTTVEVDGVWYSPRGVEAHTLRITRRAGNKTYVYDGALSTRTSDRERYPAWFAGTYTVSTQVWVRSGGRIVPEIRTREPFPFTGDANCSFFYPEGGYYYVC